MTDVDVVALTAVEKKIGLRRPAFGRRFVRVDRWLVAESVALSKLALGRWRRLNLLNDRLELPRLDLTKDSWLTARQNGSRFRLPLRCSALYQGRQTRRAFYLARGLTIKLLPPGRAPTCDVEARALIASAGNVNVPKVIGSGVLDDRAFIVEQLIAGHHPRLQKEEGIIDILLPAVWANYRAFGFGTTETFPGLTVQAIQEELVSVSIPERMTYERECRDELIRQIRLLPNTTEHPLVTTFGHGDLSVGNIVVTGSGALFVIDWETAGQMPIVWDLRKLMAVPGLLTRAIELLRAELQRLGWRDVMSAEGQFLLGLGARVAERGRGALDPKHTLRAFGRVGRCLHTVLH